MFLNYPFLIYLYSQSSPFQKKRPFLKNKNKKSTETATLKEETVPKEIRIRGPLKFKKKKNPKIVNKKKNEKTKKYTNLPVYLVFLEVHRTRRSKETIPKEINKKSKSPF
ncbi:unnamed protein product [Rhizophagus irregularis]|nr:unnamed protein product [Rhizophagus irregularis]